MTTLLDLDATTAAGVGRAIDALAGRRIAVLAKYEMTDAVPGGLWLDESIAMARLLEPLLPGW